MTRSTTTDLRMAALSMATQYYASGLNDVEIVERAQRYYDFLAGKTTSAKPSAPAKPAARKQ